MADKVLTRDDVLNAQDSFLECVQVPEWGGSVCIKSLSGAERDEFEATIFDGNAKRPSLRNMRAKLLVIALVDGERKRLFTEHDISRLGAKNGKVLGRLYEIARKLNGIGVDEEEKLLKNLEGGGIDDSTSPSPKT